MSLEPISTAEAAQRLGVTPTTVRRMIAAGRLRAVQERRPQGARFRVLWNDQDSTPTVLPPETPRAARGLLDELTDLRCRVEAAARRRDRACRRLSAQTSTAPAPEPARAEAAEPVLPRRPLWRSLWGRRA
jgi:excisionase family DNA binding protein